MGRTNSSKYDEYFEINHDTKKAECKTCGDLIGKNCTGMRKHMKTRHKINIPKQNSNSSGEEDELPSPSPRKRSKKVEIEPIEDQVCEEAALNNASFKYDSDFKIINAY